jgi:DNA-binding CsgD family transcriptional regulator
MKQVDLIGHFDLNDATNCEGSFSDILFQMREKFGFDHVAYAGVNPINGTTHSHMTYDKAWAAHYIEQGFYRIDPTLTEARRSIAPVDWGRLEHTQNFKTVFRDAHDFNISDTGLTIPIHGPYGDIGGLSVTSNLQASDWQKLRQETISDLQSLAVYFHDLIIRSDPLSKILDRPNLSSRETEILQWIAAGKSQQDIGDILSISHRTVEVHLRSARSKLAALTTPQAIGRAISLGLVYPE